MPRTSMVSIRLMLGLAAVITSVSTATADNRWQRPAIQGLTAVGVMIEDLSQELEQDGVTESHLQTDVERRLRKAGIRVLTDAQWQEAPESPYLYVRVTAAKRAYGLYGYAISVHLKQVVVLTRDPGIRLFAATWETGGVGTIGAMNVRGLRQSVTAYVDEFITAYRTMNPEAGVGRELSHAPPLRNPSTRRRPPTSAPSAPPSMLPVQSY
jgi:hypothetical protein